MAKSFLAKKELDLENCRVKVAQYTGEEEEEMEPEEEVEEEDVPSSTNTIHVSGIHKSVSKDLLEMYFDNKERSGGGPISHITYPCDEGTARIVFEKEKGKVTYNKI